MQKFVQQLSNLGPPGSRKAEGSTFGPYVKKTAARVNKHSEKFVLFCFFEQFYETSFVFCFLKESLTLACITFLFFLCLKMGKEIYNHLFPVPAREKKTPPLTSSLCFPPASAPSADKLYFVIHVTLRLEAVNTLAFISYAVPATPPFTTVKTCGAKKIIYGCLCPFQSSSSPALPGECR